MNDFTKAALTQEIKSSWVFKYEVWYIATMKRRGNRTAFYITIASLLCLLFVTRWLAAPILAFALFMCFTSIYGAIKEHLWTIDYNITLPEVQGLITEVLS